MRSSFLSLTHLLAHQPRVTAFNSIYRTLNKTTIVGMPHATAKVDGITIADTDNYEVVEGNIYFPPSSITESYFKPTSTTSACPWKGTASYYTISVDGKELKDAAWYYPAPKDKAKNIEGYVAFYKNKVEITSE